MIGLGILFIVVSGVWLWVLKSETRPPTAVLPDALSDPTATSTTVTEVSLPAPTKRVVATLAPSPTVETAPTMTVQPPTATVAITAKATAIPTPQVVNGNRLVIASIGVDAPIEVIGVDADNVMQTPSLPTSVGWYDFSAHPGEAGNIVFAGHVDYHDYGKAVFWYLDQLQPGDTIDVYTDRGTIVTYRVTDIGSIDANADAQSVIAPTSTPTITLITCEGHFDPSTRHYDRRLVVKGDLVGTK